MSFTIYNNTDELLSNATWISFLINGDIRIEGAEDGKIHEDCYHCSEDMGYTIKDKDKKSFLDILKKEYPTIANGVSEYALIKSENYIDENTEKTTLNPEDKMILLLLERMFSVELGYRRIRELLEKHSIPIEDLSYYG